MVISPRRFTAADLAAMPDQLPSGPVNFELRNGSFVLMSPTGRRHGNLQSRLSKAFVTQGEEKVPAERQTLTQTLVGRRDS